jgi:hypothetical protein
VVISKDTAGRGSFVCVSAQCADEPRDGEVVVRTPEGEETAVRGDAVCFPVGPDGAGSPDDRVILRREDGNRDYRDREP